MAVHKKRKKKKAGMPSLPVNSFADIAFLLIVFFVIASTLSQTRGIVADIPSGEKSESKTDKTTILQLHEDRMTFNDKVVTLPALKKRLAELEFHKKEAEAKIVLLEAIGNVEYQTYFSAMTAISAAGGVIAIVKEDGE
ncbi:MAG: biopolymer transporter ExbD [Kiritimatiellia bacterium]|jgi:biopolymer transport protein ExbD|nr:biopolymer transporter ExbD [Kiritimatiellia bacterium]MDP6847271.1 biopolymer transporter ExbD [Kiritimatiellia bacterium]